MVFGAFILADEALGGCVGLLCDEATGDTGLTPAARQLNKNTETRLPLHLLRLLAAALRSVCVLECLCSRSAVCACGDVGVSCQ